MEKSLWASGSHVILIFAMLLTFGCEMAMGLDGEGKLKLERFVSVTVIDNLEVGIADVSVSVHDSTGYHLGIESWTGQNGQVSLPLSTGSYYFEAHYQNRSYKSEVIVVSALESTEAVLIDTDQTPFVLNTNPAIEGLTVGVYVFNDDANNDNPEQDFIMNIVTDAAGQVVTNLAKGKVVFKTTYQNMESSVAIDIPSEGDTVELAVNSQCTQDSDCIDGNAPVCYLDVCDFNMGCKIVELCDDGLDCTTDSCNANVCTNQVDSDKCAIGDGCYIQAALNPVNSCQKCDIASPTVWTDIPDCQPAMICEGDASGNNYGVGKACTQNGGECTGNTQAVDCLDGLGGNPPAICTVMNCANDAACGDDSTCMDGGGTMICIPNRCLPIECEGDAGNTLGVGKACTQGGGECPTENDAVCVLDLVPDGIPICVITNCTADAECGPDAQCEEVEPEFFVCLPDRCIQ